MVKRTPKKRGIERQTTETTKTGKEVFRTFKMTKK